MHRVLPRIFTQSVILNSQQGGGCGSGEFRPYRAERESSEILLFYASSEIKICYFAGQSFNYYIENLNS